MTRGTDNTITALLSADETITESQARAALDILRGVKRGEERADYPLTRAEAAKRLRVSNNTITNWGKAGIIRRVTIPGRRKALGYSEADVCAILNGKGVNA